MQACEALPFRPMPKAILYGNIGTWGSLGVDSEGRLFQSIDEVSDRFGALCSRFQEESGFGQALRCHADLIGVAPTGRISRTEQVAQRLVDDHGALLSIDMRPSASKSYGDIVAEIHDVFSGETSIISDEFLDAHPVGLSLDLEQHVVLKGWRPTAYWINLMCNTHRDLMVARGHSEDELDCFLYEFAKPTMVWNPDKLEPWIYAALMSRADYDRTVDELERDGVPITEDTIRERALQIKDEWIDLYRAAYEGADRIGCMFVEADYLTPGERDMFSFEDGLNYFGHKCDVYSFQ
jgi:hypothetical protein